MSQVLGYLVLALVAAFLAYRQACVQRYDRRRRLARRPFGVRIVLTRKAAQPPERIPTRAEVAEFVRLNPPSPFAPPRSTNGHRLRLAVHNRHLTTTERLH